MSVDLKNTEGGTTVTKESVARFVHSIFKLGHLDPTLYSPASIFEDSSDLLKSSNQTYKSLGK